MSAAPHSFGGQRLDRYVFEFETDLGGDDGGSYDAAEAALAGTLASHDGVVTETPAEETAADDVSYDDVLAAVTTGERADAEIDPEVLRAFDEWSLPKTDSAPLDEPAVSVPDGWTPETIEAALGFVEQLAAAASEQEADAAHQRIEAALEEALDPLGPDYARNLVAVQQMLASGDLRVDENGRYVARAEAFAPPAETGPDLDAFTRETLPGIDPAFVPAVLAKAEAVIDEIAEITGLSGSELVATSLQTAAEILRRESAAGALPGAGVETFAAQEALRVDQRVASALQTADRLFAEIAPGADRLAVQERAGELIEPLKEATGLSGIALAREALRLAAEDVAETDDYDEAQRRMTARVQAGVPVRRSGLGQVDAAPVVAERPVFDSYDEVEQYHRSLAKES